MDYRYETKEEARGFHQERIAFIVINNKLEFLPTGSKMSHYEYCQTKGINKEVFNTLLRGYYLDGNLVIYKDRFIYDDDLIKESLKYLDEISNYINIDEFNIYYGQLPDEGFKLDYYYGKYQKGSIIHE